MYLFILALFIVPCLGIFFSSFFGRTKNIGTQYQGFSQGEIEGTTTEKITKVMTWILYPQLLAILLYLPTYYLYSNDAAVYSWLVVPLFWIVLFLWILILGRIRLINIHLFTVELIASLIFAFVFLRRIFEIGPQRILPDDADVVFQFWLVVIIYFVLAAIRSTDSEESHRLRKKLYWVNSAKRIEKKYKKQFSECNETELNLILAILVKENFERPRLFRAFERQFGQTTGIAQFKGKHSDLESITLCVEKICEILKEFYSNEENAGITGTMMTDFVAMRYNYDSEYAEDVWNIYLVLGGDEGCC